MILSKTIDGADFEELRPELSLVDRWFTSAREQHPMRRWEYALAIRARRQWLQWDYEQRGHAGRTHGHRIVDVGGAGSPFASIVGEDSGSTCLIIDPDHSIPATLDQHLHRGGHIAHEVYCLSVLEHVDDLGQFLYHLSCLTAPGGLLFLTMDACGCSIAHGGEDSHHFHWMRKRIFTGDERRSVWAILRDCQMENFGTYDPRYYGDHVYDYSFASLALVKRP